MTNHPSKNCLARNMQILQAFFLQDLARFCIKSCKSSTNNEAFLARYKKTCKNLIRKNFKIIFLQDFDHILQRNYVFPQDSCKLCKNSFIFSARLARYVQELVQDLANLRISCKTVFTEINDLPILPKFSCQTFILYGML